MYRKETGKVTVDYNLFMSTRRYMQSLSDSSLLYQFKELNYAKDETFSNIKDVQLSIYGIICSLTTSLSHIPSAQMKAIVFIYLLKYTEDN